MRMRSLLTSAALAGVLVAGGSLYSGASAQKGAFMTPSTAWAVNSVKSEKAPYCALAKKFDSNAVLTIARNPGLETSFALDFQRPTLPAEDVVDIVLDPGSDQQRRYNVMPVSEKAFVARMGRDESFFAALVRTGLLRVEVGEQLYTFNVSDIDAGLEKLRSCVQDIQPVVAQAPETKGPDAAGMQAAIAQAGEAFRQEIAVLHRQIMDLKRENEDLKGQALSAQNTAQSAAQNTGDAQAVEAASYLADEVRRLELVNEELKGRLDLARMQQEKQELDVAGDAAQQASVEILSNELTTMRAENERLKAQLQTGLADDGKLAALEREKHELQVRNETLEAALNAKGSHVVENAKNIALVSDLKAQVHSLKTQNVALREAASSAPNEEATAPVGVAQVAQYEQKIQALKKENAALHEQLKHEEITHDKQAEELVHKIAELNAENATFHDKLRKEGGLTGQRAKLLRQKMVALNTENQRLQERAQAAEKAKAEQVNILQEQVATLEGVNTSLRNRLDEMDLAWNSLDRSNKAKSAEHVEEVEILREEQKALERQLTLAREDRVRAEVEVQSLKSEVRALEAALRESMSLSSSNAKVTSAERAAIVPPQQVAVVEPQDAVPVSDDAELAQEHYAVNEAQRQEYAMKVDAVSTAQETREDDLSASMSVQQSADPFEDMDVVEDAAPETSNVHVADNQDTKMFGDDQPVQTAETQVSEIVEQTSLTRSSLVGVVAAAGIVSPEQAQIVHNAEGGADVAYEWQTDKNVFGSAEQHLLSSDAAFDDFVQTYLERTQERCPGEFAVVPDRSVGEDAKRVDSYDVACVGGNVSAGASLLFFNKDGVFSAVAHEAPAEALDTAIDLRNQLMTFLTGDVSG